MWEACLVLSIIVLIGFCLLAGTNRLHISHKLLNPIRVIFCGVFIADIMLFLPIYYLKFDGEFGSPFNTFLLSIHNTLRLFVLDGDFDFIINEIAPISGWLHTIYMIWAAILFVASPILTFGFVLSFFKNITSYTSYLLHYRSDVYIFSELNEKSLILAESIRRTNKKCLLLFTDVYETEEETNFEHRKEAQSLNALCFKKDIVTVNFKFHSQKSLRSFFMIGADETENIDQALTIISTYGKHSNSRLYVFSTSIEGELLLNSAEKANIKVRRINEVQSFIFRNLYENGAQIFDTAKEEETGKQIHAVVLGLGRYGTEMVKALTWFCQMDGYRLKIDAYDQDEKAREKFALLCPDLISPEHNGVFIDGDSQYTINIHNNVDVRTGDFADNILSMEVPTYIFVCLGDDVQNIRTAVDMRILCERRGINPPIQAIVCNSRECKTLTNIQNFKGQAYNIDFVGDFATSYSQKVIINSELEMEALARHTKWGDEDSFWNFEYNYRSSTASAIHKKMKIHCGIPGIELPVQNRTEEEKYVLRNLEHRRWSAYMRSEGYVYAPKRNDLAKTHHCLIPYDELPEHEKAKDDD